MQIIHFSTKSDNYAIGPIENYTGDVSTFSRNDYEALSNPRYFCYESDSAVEPIVTSGRNRFEATVRRMQIQKLDYHAVGRYMKENSATFQDWHNQNIIDNPDIRGYSYNADGLKIVCVFKGWLEFIKK